MHCPASELILKYARKKNCEKNRRKIYVWLFNRPVVGSNEFEKAREPPLVRSCILQKYLSFDFFLLFHQFWKWKTNFWHDIESWKLKGENLSLLFSFISFKRQLKAINNEIMSLVRAWLKFRRSFFKNVINLNHWGNCCFDRRWLFFEYIIFSPDSSMLLLHNYVSLSRNFFMYIINK